MMKKIIDFLDELESRKIYYRLNKVRDGIMVEVAVPGQRWKIEFFDDHHVEIEKFISNGEIYSEQEINNLLSNFSD